MSTILIVDDMPLCLETIAEVLRGAKYKVICAASGQAALDILRRERVDLLLLDVLMPGLDGLAVLGVLRKNERWRGLPVILLTDAAEKHRVHAAASLGIQGYILKSQFSLKELLSRVQTCLASSGSTAMPGEPGQAAGHGLGSPAPRAPSTRNTPAGRKDEPEILARVRRHVQLKSVPPVLQHVMALAHDPRSGINEIVNAVRQDQALAIKVMRMANSSFYATDSRAQNLAEATQRIGLSGIRNAATAILAMDHFGATSTGGLIPQRFWEHSLGTAVLTQMIGEAIGLENAEELFLAGLLHDVGRLVLSSVCPEEYRQALAAGEGRNLDLACVEQEIFGLRHSDVTREVLKDFKMSDAIIAAASLHSCTVEELKRTGRDSRSALAVCLANRIAHATLLGDSGNSMLHPLHEAAEALGLSTALISLTAREALNRTRDAGLVYACRGDVDFREPLAAELAKQTGHSIRLTILADQAASNPFSLFCERLGWLAPESPEIALIYVTSERQMQQRFDELRKLENGTGSQLAILLASGGASTPPPDDLIQARAWRPISLPTRYATVAHAVCELQSAAPARACAT